MNIPTSTSTSTTRTAMAVLPVTLLVAATTLGAPGAVTTDTAPNLPATGTAPPFIPLPPPQDFVATVTNPFSPFVPGMRWVYRGGTPQEPERIVVKVLDRTRVIEGIEATVVRDTVKVDGELVEDTFDWYAQDRRGRVWYLGEATKEYEDGDVVSTEGSWEAGADGARAGVVMFKHPRVGKPYRQEYYAGHAEDQAKLLTLDTRVATEAGGFRHVRMTEDTTPLAPEVAELKFYARGVGVVLEFDLAPDAGRTELIRFRAAE